MAEEDIVGEREREEEKRVRRRAPSGGFKARPSPRPHPHLTRLFPTLRSLTAGFSFLSFSLFHSMPEATD